VGLTLIPQPFSLAGKSGDRLGDGKHGTFGGLKLSLRMGIMILFRRK
jgi:hypothetical protein